AVDRAVRAAAHGPDHERILATDRLLVLESAGQRGYAYVRPSLGPTLLAATDEAAASTLLWEALARLDGHAEVGHITGGQRWVVPVALAAGLSLRPWGALFLRGMAEPPAYLPSGPFL